MIDKGETMKEKKSAGKRRGLSTWMVALVACAALVAGCLFGLIACSSSSPNTNSGANATASTSNTTTTAETTNIATNSGSYSIQYNLSNGTIKSTGASPKLDLVTSNCGSSVTLYTLDQTGWTSAASQAGYVFLGWSYTGGATNTKVDYTEGTVLPTGLTNEDGTAVSDGETVNLYGVWQQS
jgi:hypothetical protein